MRCLRFLPRFCAGLPRAIHCIRAEKRPHVPENAEKPEEKRNSFDEQFMNLMHYTGEKQNEG